MTDVLLTQAGAEVVYAVDPRAQLTQAGVEVVRTATDAFIATAVLLSQAGVEVVYPAVSASGGDGRVSQLVVEDAQQYGAVPARVGQVVVEDAQQYGAVPSRVSQLALELLHQYPSDQDKARVSQIVLEFARPLSYGCGNPQLLPPAPGAAGCPATLPVNSGAATPEPVDDAVLGGEYLGAMIPGGS